MRGAAQRRRPGRGLGRARRARRPRAASAAASAGSGAAGATGRRRARRARARARGRAPSFRPCAAAPSAWKASGVGAAGIAAISFGTAASTGRRSCSRASSPRTRVAGAASGAAAASRARRRGRGRRRAPRRRAAAPPACCEPRARRGSPPPSVQLVRASAAVANSASRAQTGLGAQRSAQSAVISATPGPSSRSIGSRPQSALEGGVDEDEHARGVEHRDRLGHPVERRLAELELGAVAALQHDRGRDVLEQEGERPLRVRPAGDAEDLARRQLPVLLVGARRGRPPRARRACGARRRSPSARASAGSRAAARGSRASYGPAGEPDRVDLHEVGQRRVEEPEAAVLVEDREADRQVGEGLGQRLDEAAQRRLGGDQVVGGEREAEGLAGRRRASG